MQGVLGLLWTPFKVKAYSLIFEDFRLHTGVETFIVFMWAIFFPWFFLALLAARILSVCLVAFFFHSGEGEGLFGSYMK